ncbi:MAG: hypothetical protein JSR98_05715 [Proteobacteria bacterium]|nr:hypothetical protein [Pseudomonadota bacterium]
MIETLTHSAALILDENGVWLRLPQEDGRPIPRYVLAARELAARLATPDQIERLAAAFERRQACRGIDGLDDL